MVRKRQFFIDRYGEVAGSKLYHALQSQAAHAGVSVRLRRKLTALEKGEPWPPAVPRHEPMPLFPDEIGGDGAAEAAPGTAPVEPLPAEVAERVVEVLPPDGREGDPEPEPF
jgi:hypothetical protein